MLSANTQIKSPVAAMMPPANIVTLYPSLWMIKLATGAEKIDKWKMEETSA